MIPASFIKEHEMIPHEKNEAVTRAVREAFGVAGYDR